jgi:hypothetical protein
MSNKTTQAKPSKIADCVDDIVEAFHHHCLDPFDTMAALIILTSITVRGIAKHSHVPVSAVRSEFDTQLTHQMRKDASQA